MAARGDEEEVSDILLESPKVDRSVLRLVLALVPTMNWRIASIDITNAFLQGKAIEPDRVIYIKPPPEVTQGMPGLFWRAKKCIYGLLDGPRSCHIKVAEILVLMINNLGILEF